MDKEQKKQPLRLHKFYKSNAWRNCRKEVLKEYHYKCAICGKKANTVHHLINVTLENVNKADVVLNPKYCIALCDACHTEIHRLERLKKEGKQE